MMSQARIALCTAHPFPPQLIGGAQRSMQQLAKILSKSGYDVCFMTGLSGRKAPAFRARVYLKATSNNLYCDQLNEFDTYRSWFPENNVEEFVGKFHPDVAICFSGRPTPIAKAFAKEKIPTIIYFRNVEEDDFGGAPTNAADSYISNSSFTADFVERRYGIESCVIPPYIEPSEYRTDLGNKVTFINPQVDKGRNIVFDVARRFPDIPFLIVKAWSLNKEDISVLASLQNQCANVEIVEPTSDMRNIYGQTKILFAPSQWDEAWGRVATEAHFSGIPVLASDAGGLPESVGPGGVILPRDAPIEEWCSALSQIWYNHGVYAELSAKAEIFSKRETISLEHIAARLDAEIQRLLVG